VKSYILPMLRFAIVGGFNTLLDAGLFSVFCLVLGMPPGIANILSYSAGIVASFLLNRVWTFSDHARTGPVMSQAVRFLLVALSAMVLSTVIVTTNAAWIGPLTAKLVSIPITYLWNYVLVRHFVFAPARATDMPR